MQTDNRLLDDLARLIGGAAGVVAGARDEVQALMRDRLQRLLDDMRLVGREEFEAVRAMAEKARLEQAALAGRIDALSARIEAVEQTLAERREP
ncbi:MAG: accessory factor UbiK family protein [Alphaproteobacteria bacterium]|nr:accessory factor UbiK family protein [Alphaproteobacteria bacterium]